MFGLSTLGTKIAIGAIIAAIVTSAIGGFFLYQNHIVSGLQDIIDQQQGEIKTLTTNNIKLVASNVSLETQITKKAEETKSAYEELTRLREKDVASVIRLNTVENILRDRNRNDRMKAIRFSRKASLILRLMDKDVACQTVNFYNINGKCVRGRWIEEGTRLVPVISTEEKGTSNENQ